MFLSFPLNSKSCPQHHVLKHIVHPIRTGVLWRHVVWKVGPLVRVNILLPSSMCQCCGRAHHLHMFHTDTLPPQDMWIPLCRTRGTRWRGWLRHCATSQKVAGSIPDGVIGIFLKHNPSGRNMVLELTQPLTELSTRYISWEVKAAGA